MQIRLILPFALAATPVFAEPSIVVDLPATAGLVAAVAGVDPFILSADGSDPHHVTMRPSEARAMENADLVILVEGLAPAYLEAARSLSPQTLLLTAGDTQDGHQDHDEDAAQTSDDHAHSELHGWLDPATASSWLDEIAAELSRVAPGSSAIFSANAAAGRTRIEAAANAARASLAADPPGAILAVHDAWDAAQRAFDLPVVGAIAGSDAARPGARHLREIETLVGESDVACVLAATGEGTTYADRFDLPMVTLPLTGDPDVNGLDRYLSLIAQIGTLGRSCPPVD